MSHFLAIKFVDESGAYDFQSGHTSKTARAHYGVNQHSLYGTNHTTWELARYASVEWHIFLGVASIPENNVTAPTPVQIQAYTQLQSERLYLHATQNTVQRALSLAQCKLF
jgi:hypothetical protein